MNLPVPLDLATMFANVLLDAVFLKGLVLAAVAIVIGTGLRRTSAAGRGAIWCAGSVGMVLLFGNLILWLLKEPLPPVWDVNLASFPQQLYRQVVPGVTLNGSEASVAAWLGMIWALGAVVLLVRFGCAFFRIWRVTRRAMPLGDASLVRAVHDMAGGSRRRAVRVLLTNELDMPVTWGVARPVILLPATARSWSADLLRAVLRHEATHVARSDYLTLVAFEIGCALHWPNPLAWYLARRARLDQERACDDAVIEDGIAPAEYARHLVTVARGTLRPRTLSATLPLARRTMLWDRVRDVMRLDANRRPPSRPVVWLGFLAMAAVTIQISISNLWACPTGLSDAAPSEVVSNRPVLAGDSKPPNLRAF